MAQAASPWSAPVEVDDIPETGLHQVIEAPEDVRAALAKLTGLRALPRLIGEFDLTRRGSAVQVTGQVSAQVGQTCVVTLDPIDNAVEEAVDVEFVPASAAGVDTDGGDAQETYSGGQIDLGALAAEFLMLGIDPYPRKPGAEFSPPRAEPAGEHPFAALAALKKAPKR